MSIRKAAGGTRSIMALLQSYLKKDGYVPTHGRWRDFSGRASIIRDGRKNGLTWNQIGQRLYEAEGKWCDPYEWAKINMPREEWNINSILKLLSNVRSRREDPGIEQEIMSLKGKKSARVIAAEMGLASRNVVIGIWNRASLKRERAAS